MPIILYDLACANNRRPSPFCWRVKYALAHKGLEFDTIPVKFTEIRKYFDGQFNTLPTIDDNGKIINDSDAIAEYLNIAYPHKPLFLEDSEHSHIASLEEWQMKHILPNLFSIYAFDIYNGVSSEDKDYFRSSRELDLGCSLEESAVNRDVALGTLRKSLNPLRKTLLTSPFLSGDNPNYADYIIVSSFLWIASVSTMPLLEANDPLLGWISRCQDLFNNIGYRWPLNQISE